MARVPLQRCEPNIDYGFYEARTTFGRIRRQVLINKGEIMPEGYTGADLTDMSAPPPPGSDRGDRGERDGGGAAAAEDRTDRAVVVAVVAVAGVAAGVAASGGPA